MRMSQKRDIRGQDFRSSLRAQEIVKHAWAAHKHPGHHPSERSLGKTVPENDARKLANLLQEEPFPDVEDSDQCNWG